MEYRNLVTFLRVAELQNFTQAANALGYAQSTVTFHIQSLEEELGVVLFDRIGKKVALTMAGEYLISYVNEMMHLEADIKTLNKKIESLPGRLRVGVVESLLTPYAAKAIPLFGKRYPKISLEIRTSSSLDLMELLRSNEVDVILFMGKKLADSNFVRDLIKPAQVCFVAAPTNPLAGKEKVDFMELVKQPLILPERASLYRRAAEEIAAQFDQVLEPSIQISNTATIVELIKAGAGISFLPSYLIEKDVEEGRLAVLQVEKGVTQNYYVQLLHHRNKWVTPQMRGFVSMMKEILGCDCGGPEGKEGGSVPGRRAEEERKSG